ncbi:HmgD family protein [Megaselia abdita]
MAEKPKRPLSAYMIWLNETRESIKKEHPNSKVTEIAKYGGEKWRALTDKSEWEKKAAEAKENYEKELRKFEANGGSVTETKKASKRGGGKAAAASKSKAKKKPVSSEEEEESE